MALNISSATFDKTVYNPGDVVTLTVGYTTDDSSTVDSTFNAAVTVSNSADTASVTAPFEVSGAVQMLPVTVSVSDDRSPAGAWSVVSNTVTGAGPWDGVAVLTSVA